MSLKLILISPSGTFATENKLYADVVNPLCAAIERLKQQGVTVALWSNRALTVSGRPMHEYLSEIAKTEIPAVGVAHGGYPARRRNGSVDPILARFGARRRETILVGNGDEDMMAGVNNRLLLIRPSWYPGEHEYGFAVKSVAELERFCTIFGLREHPIYWAVSSNNLRVSAMGPYSTRIQAYAGFGVDALQAAKYEKGTLDFWLRLAVSTLYFSGLIEDVHYIATYPGHTAGYRMRAIDDVMSALGKCFRKTFYPDLIVRHSTAAKSAHTPAHLKTFRTQVESICLNRYPHPNGNADPRKSPLPMAGKRVLVVDDICTNGRSLDTARAYIESAGGEAVLFSWLKTINTDFLSM